MLLSTEEEEISKLPLTHEEELMKSPPTGPNPESVNAALAAMESSESPSEVFATFNDVHVAREHEKNQLEQNIRELEEEIVNLRMKERSLDERRREALNKILDIKGCIRVFCRMRPFLSTDRRRILQPISIESEKIVVRSGGSSKEFAFDKVFNQEASQENVFVEVEPILRSALDGHNVCILAYGQTGTGKTFTMDGTSESPGIIPRVLERLFSQASLDSSTTYSFAISMMEIYVGTLRDLLAPKPYGRTYAASKCNLNIQTDSKGSVEVEGLTEVQISNFVKASWWYNKGRRVRSTSWTNVNEASSRSHCLTRITVYRTGDSSGGQAEVVSKVWMVDLGGSERLLKTGATGQTLDEGRAINLSLSALGDVIAALRRKKGHVPYRNSKLTQILKDSLGGGSKVVMVMHVSPYEEDVGETTCSFTFAKRVRTVECSREVSEELKQQKEKRIADLEKVMSEAEGECEKLRNLLQKAEYLLSENKKIFVTKYQLLGDEEQPLLSPKGNLEELLETPRASDKAVRRNITHSLPRFMNSTVASRQRKNTAEREIDGSNKTLRSWARSSAQISGSQSISYSDPRLKVLLKNPSKRPRYGETNSSVPEVAKGNGSESKLSALPQVKMVTSSDPNMKIVVVRHRRRMSDLL